MIGLLRVEDATAADADPIRALAIARSTADLLERDLADPARPCLVARLDGEVVGVAIGGVQLDEGHVHDLAVAERVRGQGIGARLLAALEDALQGRGATATTLEVRPSNVAARGLYGRLGFVEEGRRRAYYPDGEDALVLWRCTSPDADVEASATGEVRP